MDVLLLLMGVTLMATGWFLLRDFSRFLRCAYTVEGRVVSLLPGFGSKCLGRCGSSTVFFPVIEYNWLGENLHFSALDKDAIAKLQIGDDVLLQISRSRRKSGRLGRMPLTLGALMVGLCIVLLAGSAFFEQSTGLLHILLFSFVFSICLLSISTYLRHQDLASDEDRSVARQDVFTRIFLREPTSACHWSSLFAGPREEKRIAFSRFLGGGCFVMGLALIVLTFYLCIMDTGFL